MDYQRIGLPQILLLAWVGVLLCGAGAICGCGSNEGPSSNRQKEKPAVAASAKPLVKELLPNASPEAAIPPAQLLGRVDPGSIEVFPPDASGNPGMTLAELQAKTAAEKPMDPALVPVFPPDASGKSGMTLAELQAKAAATERMNPGLPMPPPDDHGARRMVTPPDNNIRRD